VETKQPSVDKPEVPEFKKIIDFKDIKLGKFIIIGLRGSSDLYL